MFITQNVVRAVGRGTNRTHHGPTRHAKNGIKAVLHEEGRRRPQVQGTGNSRKGGVEGRGRGGGEGGVKQKRYSIHKATG